MPIIDSTLLSHQNQDSGMTLDQALEHLEDIKNSQANFYQDEAVKYAIAVLEALKGNG
jgi:hypothetical protein